MEHGIAKSNGKGLRGTLLLGRQPEQESVVELGTGFQHRYVKRYGVKSYEEFLAGSYSPVHRPTFAYPPGRLTGPVQFLSKLIDLWKLDRSRASILLGYETSDRQYVEAILSGETSFRGRDAKDRVTNLYKIRAILASVFRDLEVENEWLREPQKILGDKAPLELLLDGSMENLLRVRLLVERMGGR